MDNSGWRDSREFCFPKRKWGILVVVAVQFLAGAALAQAPPQLPGPAEPRFRVEPPPIPAPEADIDLTLPSPRRTPDPRAVDELRFLVRDVVLEGNSVFSRAELAPFVDKLIGQTVGLTAVIAAAEEIEAKYRGAGYILSRAFVPPQRVGDGIFRIQIVEGYVKSVVVEGVEGTLKQQLERRLQPLTALRPVTLAGLERALLLAGDLPGVTSNGVLRPGDEPGAADLVVTASVTNFDGLATLSNRGSPFAGPWSTYGEASYNSALNGGDKLTIGGSITPDLHEQRLATTRYLMPVGGNGATLLLDGQYTTGESGHTLRAFDVRSRGYKVGAHLSYPIRRSRRENLILDGGVNWQETRVDVLHTRFTHDAYPTADIRLTYSEYGAFLRGGTSISGGITRGLGLFGFDYETSGARSREDADPHFLKFNTEIRRLQPLWDRFSASASILGQYSASQLYAGEEFTIGGSRIGRGYDPSELTGKHGIGGAFELRYGETVSEGYQLYTFYDHGRVWRDAAGSIGEPNLRSAGFGARFSVLERHSATIEIARALSPAGVASWDGQRPIRLFVDLLVTF